MVDLSKTEELPKGAVCFFKTFSRFEFALKESRYLPKSGRAIPFWNDFAKCLGDEFYKEVRESNQAQTLLSEPPKVQVSANRALNFVPTSPPKNTQQLFEAVRRVRDNLFRGGKNGHPDEDPSEPGRNERLIAEAQWVLEMALLKHDDVRWAFEGRY